MANELARTRLLWAILSLVLVVTFGRTTACRRPALPFSAAIHFAIKRSAPCSAVLRHSPLSWTAVVHWSALIPNALRSSRKHPVHYFSCPPTQPAAPTSSPNTTHFGMYMLTIFYCLETKQRVKSCSVFVMASSPPKNIRELEWYLGYAVAREWEKSTVKISQSAMVDTLLTSFDVKHSSNIPPSLSRTRTDDRR